MADERITDFIEKAVNEALSRYALTSPTADDYLKKVRRFVAEAGLSPDDPGFSDKSLQSFYEKAKADFRDKEEKIDGVVAELAQGAEVSSARDKGRSVEEIIKNGPNLVLLDGGPGAGKSTGLAGAMKAMGAPVVCIGATSSAAKGLFGDMQAESLKNKEKTGKDIPVVGGMTVDQLFSADFTEQRTGFDKMFESDPKPVLMVDEAGLLDHDQLLGILSYAQVNGAKIILAGDSQQIPPGTGQPFKFLTETLKETTCYANAPYVFRQSDFADKAITSGIYKGFCSDKNEINPDTAAEFLKVAYSINNVHGVPTVDGLPADKGGYTFKKYLEDGRFGSDASAVDKYVEYLAANTEKLVGRSDESLKAVLDKGPTAEGNYDAYLCAVMVLQAKGVRGYAVRGMLDQPSSEKGDSELYASVAHDFAAQYAATLPNPPEAGDYKKGMLALTATKDEAEYLNKQIRNAIIAKSGEPAFEPVNVGGKKQIMSRDQIKAMKQAGTAFSYAYALDVTESQGMTQTGKVILTVSEKNMKCWQGGQVLVGATRHKGKKANADGIDRGLEIRLSGKADRNEFFARSVMQNASARINEDCFHENLFQTVTRCDDWRAYEDKARADRKEKREVSSEEELNVARHLKKFIAGLTKRDKEKIKPAYQIKNTGAEYVKKAVANRKINNDGR